MESKIRKSNTCAALYEALAQFQSKVENAVKNKTANVVGKSKATGQPIRYSFQYADLADVLDATRKTLGEFGLSVIQPTMLVGDQLTIVTHLAHKSGQWIESDYPVSRVGTLSHQDMGGALTYARRYALSSLLGIASETDVGGEENSEGGSQVQPGGDPRDRDDEPPMPSTAPARRAAEPPPPAGTETPIAMFERMILEAKTLADLDAIREKIRATTQPAKSKTALETEWYRRKKVLLDTMPKVTDMTDDQWLDWVEKTLDACVDIDALSATWTEKVAIGPAYEARNPNTRQGAIELYEKRERGLS